MIRKNEEVKYDNTIQNKIIKDNFDDFTREDTKKTLSILVSNFRSSSQHTSNEWLLVEEKQTFNFISHQPDIDKACL